MNWALKFIIILSAILTISQFAMSKEGNDAGEKKSNQTLVNTENNYSEGGAIKQPDNNLSINSSIPDNSSDSSIKSESDSNRQYTIDANKESNSKHHSTIPRKGVSFTDIPKEINSSTEKVADNFAPSHPDVKNISLIASSTTTTPISIITMKTHRLKPTATVGDDEPYAPSHFAPPKQKVQEEPSITQSKKIQGPPSPTSQSKTNQEGPPTVQSKKNQEEPLIVQSKKDLKNSSTTTTQIPINQTVRQKLLVVNPNRHSDQNADYIVPVVITMLVVPLMIALTIYAYRHGSDWWDRRHYRRMDFLIEGIYNN